APGRPRLPQTGGNEQRKEEHTIVSSHGTGRPLCARSEFPHLLLPAFQRDELARLPSVYLLTSILVAPPGPPDPGPPGPSGIAEPAASATTSLTQRASSSRKYDVSLASRSASTLFCSTPRAAVVNSGSSKITNEPCSISCKDRDSVSL